MSSIRAFYESDRKKTLKRLFSSIAQVAIAHTQNISTVSTWNIKEVTMRKKNVRNQVIPILLLLQSTESHLGSGNVFLRVLEVIELYIIQPQLGSYSLLFTTNRGEDG